MGKRRRRPISLPPDMIRVVPQNGADADCCVATLGTLFGWTRDEALLICGAAAPDVLADGMSDAEINAALSLAGVRAARMPVGAYDLHDATGVLSVQGKGGSQHVVVLWAGRIIEGNGEHWLDPDDYLQHYGYTAGKLLVRAEREAP